VLSRLAEYDGVIRGPFFSLAPNPKSTTAHAYGVIVPHIPFAMNRTFNATLTEVAQQGRNQLILSEGLIATCT